MNFRLGEKYIVDVTEKGIIPLMEFDNSKWCNKDCDDLDFLTGEEKMAVVNDVLNKIRAEIENTEIVGHIRDVECFNAGINVALNVINKYKAESEE